MSKRQDAEKRFRERYAARATEATLIIEREVIGANVGANGYTTVAQADLLAERLQLRPDALLLDIGCGRGWPGLYIAEKTGCRVVLSDVPVAALRAAKRTAGSRNLSGRAVAVRASGTHLPFPADSFDAITHTDAL